MSNRQDKPKMSAADLVKKMRDEKGITFNLVSEAEAERYLSDINNYFRTASYRKNYQKYQRGVNQGKYMDLDFAYLQELSQIDWELRKCISAMCHDIEHDLKTHLLHDIEVDPNEDGYQIVEDFINLNPYLIGKIAPTATSTYTGELMQKYLTISRVYDPVRRRRVTTISAYNDCPVWAFVEFITFGDFIHLYEHYYDKIGASRLSTPVLNSVKSLRNACAHNNCILADLGNLTQHAPNEISRMVAGINSITSSQRRNRLSSRPVVEFLCLLYGYRFAVTSGGPHHSLHQLLSLLLKRIPQHKEFFQQNTLITGSYDFVLKTIEHLFPLDYTDVSSAVYPPKRSVGQIISSVLKELFS